MLHAHVICENASYLTRILSSRVYEAEIESLSQYVPKIPVKTGVEIWLKCEDMQPVSTFCLQLGWVLGF